jgi:7,8-dihydropterin-6-yl-methyl-4-(beta-D-ribofuranosyl)aminobenzene 5'-phosphate synthase
MMITLRCIVDNTVLRGSALWGEHGVAFWIETQDGYLLFDTGQSGDVLAHNAELMDIDFGSCDALALSHAHNDHTGGLVRFFSLSRRGMPLYASPDLFRERFTIKDGEPRNIGLRILPSDLLEQATAHLSAEPAEIMPGVWTTGEIRERLDFEGRSVQHHIRVGETWQPDPYQDDLSLVLQTSQGLVVVCGCCHAGLLNTLAHIGRLFSQPLRAIVGGTHLAAAGSETLDRVVAELRDRREGRVPDLYLNHCTGEHATIRLAQSFGEKARPCPAGTVLRFD